jgi:hypothetical protein
MYIQLKQAFRYRYRQPLHFFGVLTLVYQMASILTCPKCGATNDGSITGLNPCHLRDPRENHNFVAGEFVVS